MGKEDSGSCRDKYSVMGSKRILRKKCKSSSRLIIEIMSNLQIFLKYKNNYSSFLSNSIKLINSFMKILRHIHTSKLNLNKQSGQIFLDFYYIDGSSYWRII
jgi:hypothetical protein